MLGWNSFFGLMYILKKKFVVEINCIKYIVVIEMMKYGVIIEFKEIWWLDLSEF